MLEDLGFHGLGSDLTSHREGFAAALQRAAIVAEMMVDDRQAVQRDRFADPVADLAEYRQGLLSAGQRPLVISELDVKPAAVIQHGCLAMAVLGHPEKLQGAF